jgi:predicted permease
MTTSGILIEQTLAILIILIIGVICYKAKLIDDATNSKLSNILLTLVQPVLIFTSFQMEFKMELVEGLLISLVLAFLTHIIAITISYIFIGKKKRRIVNVDGVRTVIHVDNEDVEVERLTSSYANMGFIGIPLAYALFGSEGVFYVTAYVMAFNILMWTHGVIMISGEKNLKFKDIISKLKSPAIIAIFLGLIFFAFQIKLPYVLNQSLNYIGNINTPFGMLIAGATIAKSDIIKVFTKNLRKYYMVFLKLLLIPFILMLLYVWLPIDETVKMIAIIMAATPSTAVGTLLTIRYKKNSVLAAEIFAMTTILCVLTIPLIMKLAELLM